MAVLTVNQIIDNIDSFINNIKKLSKSYYVFVARPKGWTDDNSPPEANNSVEQTELSIYQEMIYGKLIANTDVAYMIKKIPWTNNTVYAQYSQTVPDLNESNCYVITNIGTNNEVYKCIYNNNGANSVNKPALTTTDSTFQTADGYIWKYMFSIDPGAYVKFSTSDYVPVTVNAEVESYATPGTIDYIKIANTGTNYQVYESGFLAAAAANGFVVTLPNTSSQISNYYKDSSLYLKAGGGAGQIRTITAYDGNYRQINVDQPFDTYINLNLENKYGSNLEIIEVGDTAYQYSVDIGYFYTKGTFGPNNYIIQTDTGAAGEVVIANSSHLILNKNTSTTSFSTNLAIYSTAGAAVLKTGNVTIYAVNNTIIGTNTTFQTDYSANDYIKIANSTFSYIRRITSITNNTVMFVDANTTSILADTAFKINATSVPHYSVPIAAIPTSVGIVESYGDINYKNVNGLKILISNTTPSGKMFYPGELIKQVDANNTYQAAQAIVAFANNSAMELTSVTGTFLASTPNTSLFVLGQSSNVKAYINSVATFPNITVKNPVGSFQLGQPVFIRNTYGTTIANASIVGNFITPNQLTEYVISPKVTITGDGEGALAYAYVDTSGLNPGRGISDIVMINHGNSYTTANVSITSNPSYGSGALANAIVSPIAGHGANAYMELGAKYAGVSVSFANGEIEGYKFPVVGNYRRVGIIEDPTFVDAKLTLDSFDRVKLYLGKSTGTFTVGEIAYQSNTGVAGVVVYANTVNSISGYLELKNVVGNTTFTTADGLPFRTASVDNVNTSVIGLTSGASANILTQQLNGLSNSSVSYFRILSDVESVSEITSGATASITETVSNNVIRVGKIKGHFNANDTLYDPVTNAYANVVSISIVNGAFDATTDFGHKFLQTCRIPLTSNSGTFTNNEVVTQTTTNAKGTVLTFNVDKDIVLDANSVDINTGDYLTTTGGGTAIALYSNGIYVRCTATNGNFTGSLLKSNTTVGTITAAYSVLVLYNVYGNFQTGTYQITGANSGASGLSTLANTMWYPELLRDSGSVSYIENIQPFAKSNTAGEKINIIIKF